MIFAEIPKALIPLSLSFLPPYFIIPLFIYIPLYKKETWLASPRS